MCTILLILQMITCSIPPFILCNVTPKPKPRSFSSSVFSGSIDTAGSVTHNFLWDFVFLNSAVCFMNFLSLVHFPRQCSGELGLIILTSNLMRGI